MPMMPGKWLVRAPTASANIKEGNMFRIFSSKMYVAVMMFLSTMAFSAVAAHAQIAETAVKADIPFKFTVENTTLPAGHYTISQPFDEEPTLDMRDSKKDINILLVAESVGDNATREQPSLVFDKIAGRDFLREVRTNNQTFVLNKFPQQVKLEKKGEKAQSHSVPCSNMK
jgi:hypothetical protein